MHQQLDIHLQSLQRTLAPRKDVLVHEQIVLPLIGTR
jgi:hypothetical protein